MRFLLRTVCAPDFNVNFVVFAGDADRPRVAAYLAILDVAAANIGLDVELDLLAAIGTGHDVRVIHDS
jgi:hypothetical protein